MKGWAWAWHVHHDVLVEPLIAPSKERIAFIKAEKPKAEIATRLRLLKPVRGRLPTELVKARKAYVEARKAYDEAGKAHMPALLKLHAKECPDCPWDGTTIFPSLGRRAR